MTNFVIVFAFVSVSFYTRVIFTKQRIYKRGLIIRFVLKSVTSRLRKAANILCFKNEVPAVFVNEARSVLSDLCIIITFYSMCVEHRSDGGWIQITYEVTITRPLSCKIDHRLFVTDLEAFSMHFVLSVNALQYSLFSPLKVFTRLVANEHFNQSLAFGQKPHEKRMVHSSKI